MEMTMQKATLSMRETSKTLGISLGAAYAAAHAGELPTIRIGKRMLVVRAAFERMLECAGAQQQTSEG
jgi:excisionase family DNA binding protein